MTITEETRRQVHSALWDVSNRARSKGDSPYLEGGQVNIAAFISLVAREKSISPNDADALGEALRETLANREACEYLLNSVNDDILELATQFTNRFSEDELREIVLHYEGDERLLKAAGTHSTPSSICAMAYSILDIRDGDSIADFGCARGGFLLGAIGRANQLRLYGIEIDQMAAAVAAIRLELAGADARIQMGDLLETGASDKYDKVFSNFPLGMRPALMHGKGERYDALRSGKDGVGRPTSADWVFSKIAYDALAKGGRAVTIVSSGATFNGGDRQARKHFVERGMIQALVSLPANLFPGMAISTVLVVLGENHGPIRMVDASDLSISGRRWDTMGDDEICAALLRLHVDGDNSRLVSVDEIAATDYNLFPPRYLARNIVLENATKLGELALSIERGAIMPARELDALTAGEDTGYSYLRLSDIVDGRISDDRPHLRALDPKTERQWLRTGDLIISKNGAPFKVAVAEVPEGETILANGNLYIVRLDTARIDPYFAAAFLESEDGKEVMERFTAGTTIPNLPLRNLREMQLPVPEMSIQEAVSRQYRARLDEIEVLKIKLEKARIGIESAYDEVMGL